MQVPRFSPRISLIEMAPRPAPRSGCPGRPALPCLSPQIDRHHREWAVTRRIFQALPTQTDRHCCFNIKMLYYMVLTSIFVGQYIPIAMGIILIDHGSIPLKNTMLKAPCIDFVTLKQIAQS